MMNIQRTIILTERYLNLPVKNGAPKAQLTITVDGQAVRKFGIELTDGQPDFWVFADMQSYLGKSATIEAADLPAASKLLAGIENAAQIRDEKSIYHEKLRPLVHFTTRRGWNNDPNGLVYHKGEYHLFYQHNPYGHGWDNMHWGHAVSTDLFHWKELPTAIFQFVQCKGMAFSGSAIVDEHNIAGYQTGGEKCLIAFLTDTGSGEVLAYSNDAGLTWSLAAENPMIKHPGDGRDPRILWHAPSRQFVIAVYRVEDSKQGVAFFTSANMKQWERQSFIAGFFECPDLFELPVDGNPSQTRWVLSAADGGYMIGKFDGKVFTPDTDKIRYTYGNAYYAAQTFNNIPAADGRRIQIGWGQSTTAGMAFNQCMTIPTSLSLRTTPQGMRLTPYPVQEIERVRGKSRVHSGVSVSASRPITDDLGVESMDILLSCVLPKSGWLVLDVRGVPVFYDGHKQQLYCQGCVGPLTAVDGKLELRVVVDRSTLEIFGNKGELYMPVAVIPDAEQRTVSLSCSMGDKLKIERLEVHELHSIWG